MPELWTPPAKGDPLNMPHKGIARAGDGTKTFDTTLMTELIDINGMRLYVGGCMDGLELPYGIDYVVSLYPWERYVAHHPIDGEFYFYVYDSVDQPMQIIQTAADLANELWAQGSVLVHCQAGLNRSCTVVALMLMDKFGMSAREAIDAIREKRDEAAICNPHFEQWLLALDGE